jgi:hypothetical protein
MASRLARFYLLLSFYGGGGGVGATFSVGHRNFLFLLGLSMEDSVDIVFFGEPQARSGFAYKWVGFLLGGDSAREYFASFMLSLVSMFMVIDVWRCLLGGLSTMVFYAVDLAPTMFSLMLSLASVFESTMSLSAPEVFKKSAVSPMLQSPTRLPEAGGLFCPSEVVTTSIMLSATALWGYFSTSSSVRVGVL